MRRIGALICAAAALAAAGCERKAQDIAGSGQPAQAASAPAAPGPVAAASGTCGVIAAHAKLDMPQGFGFPVMARIAPSPGEAVRAADLRRGFAQLSAAQAEELAAGLTRQAEAGSQLDCEWSSLGLPPPRIYDKGPAFIRFRSAATGDGQLALLDTYTEAGDFVAIGTWCLYRRAEATWSRIGCVPTVIQ